MMIPFFRECVKVSGRLHFCPDGATIAQTNESEGTAMETKITREQAYALLIKYNQEPFHIQHVLTVEPVHEPTGLIWAAALQ